MKVLPQEVWDTAPDANLPTGALETRHWTSEGKDFKLGKVAPPSLAVARVKTWKVLTWADNQNKERTCGSLACLRGNSRTPLEWDIFFLGGGELVLKGLVGLHRTGQFQLLQRYWLGHRLGLL